MITVSRRSYLMSRPSEAVMRAAGAAASPKAIQGLARRQAEQRFAKLTGSPGTVAT